MGNTPGHAHINLEEDPFKGEDNVIVNSGEIGFLSSCFDQGAEFDLVIEDSLGREKFRESIKSETTRWGKRIDLTAGDSHLKVRVEIAKNAKNVDVFVD